ncbi:hypothetical protein T06_12280 [Trichinella sp. T6]|nr:hypothetical protein T06_12280 [Trichinella sp. T6]
MKIIPSISETTANCKKFVSGCFRFTFLIYHNKYQIRSCRGYLGKDATGNLRYMFVSRVDIRVICCSLLECLMCHGWHVDSESIFNTNDPIRQWRALTTVAVDVVFGLHAATSCEVSFFTTGWLTLKRMEETVLYKCVHK